MLEGDITASVGSAAVEFTYTVENVGSDPFTANYRDGQKFDVVVEDGDEEVYRWSHNRMFTMALETKTFDPGETATYSATWEDPEDGSYTATGTCAAEGVDAEATTSVDV